MYSERLWKVSVGLAYHFVERNGHGVDALVDLGSLRAERVFFVAKHRNFAYAARHDITAAEPIKFGVFHLENSEHRRHVVSSQSAYRDVRDGISAVFFGEIGRRIRKVVTTRIHIGI